MKFVFCVHAHQPVGNFDAVFQEALARCYELFLEVLARHPEVRISLHYSGCLLEWLDARAPGHLDRLGGLVERGQIELVTAGLYEPVLPAIPEWDQVAQILTHRAYLRRLLGADSRVGWLTERVWEQPVSASLARAGVETIPLDDFHFFGGGLSPEELTRPFLTEWNGSPCRLVPASEEMRMLIPFKSVPSVLQAIERHAERGDELLVFADDLEKFGLWPRTFEPVYEEGWLEAFFEGLARLTPRVETVPLGEAADLVAPGGRIYLPSGSYPEMLTWSLPARAQAARSALERDLQAAGLLDRARPFLRGGTWLNFLARYPEVQHIHKRLLEVSRRVRGEVEAIIEDGGRDPAKLPVAVRELWRAQCNCSYWHGVFGGVYLPHLRHAIFHHLLLAERALETGRPGPGLQRLDLDADLHEEAIIRGDVLEAVVSPREGGSVVELSHFPSALNLVNTLARRPEAYHRGIASTGLPDLWEERPRVLGASGRAPELEGLLKYDVARRACFLDRFFASKAGPDAVVEGVEAEIGDFAGQPYEMRAEADDDLVTVHLWREAKAGRGRLRLDKRLTLDADTGWCQAEYELRQLDGDFEGTFAVELNFALFHAAGPAGYYVLGGDRVPLDVPGTRAGLAEVRVVHESDGLELKLDIDPPGALWHLPVQTVSQSERGYELTTQSAAVLPCWSLRLRPGDAHHARLRLAMASGSQKSRR